MNLDIRWWLTQRFELPLPRTLEPARRHRCDICEVLFLCHLCDIEQDHIIHAHPQQDPDNKVFVCQECCIAIPERRFQTRRNGHNGRFTYWVDLLTGEHHLTRDDMERRCQLKLNPRTPVFSR